MMFDIFVLDGAYVSFVVADTYGIVCSTLAPSSTILILMSSVGLRYSRPYDTTAW